MVKMTRNYNYWLYKRYNFWLIVTERFDERVVDQIVFVLFFALFSRDQSFYLLAVITSCLYVTLFAEVATRAPHAYFVDKELKSPTCGHASGLGFGFPEYPVMLCVCFGVTMFLTVFNTSTGIATANGASEPDEDADLHHSEGLVSSRFSRSSADSGFRSHSRRMTEDQEGRERRLRMQNIMRKKLDFTHDNFENDLMVLPHFEL